MMRRSGHDVFLSMVAVAAAAMLLVSGCSSGSRVAAEEDEPLVAPPATWAEVETHDLSDRDVTPPVRQRVVRHDVPAILLESRADDGIVEEVQGFRVQVFSSIERNEALIMQDAVEDWIESLSDERRRELGLGNATSEAIARTVFASPYYRVRVGNFRTRNEAMALRDAMQRRFPQLLVVPDKVRVTRE